MRTALAVLAAAGTVLLASLVTAGRAAAQGPTMQQTATAAVNYAGSHGYHTAVAVLDTSTGDFAGAGDYNSAYASESVVKVFIATRLLVTGQMTGAVANTAWKMITESDDNSADALYGRVGGDSVVTWAASYFHIANLGSPPPYPGWWGGTRITASGLVRFYAAVKKNIHIAGWLFNAMHHATRYGSDGTFQWFGLPAAYSGPAVKQGWGLDFGDGSADFNSTGLVDGDRYAVAILMRGPGRSYGGAISAMLTNTATVLLPGRHVPPPQNDNPIGHLDHAYGLVGAARVDGWAFDPDTYAAIYVGLYEGTHQIAKAVTTGPRPDIDRAYHQRGNHGFGWTIRATPGSHTYCVLYYNVSRGTGNPKTCVTVAVRSG